MAEQPDASATCSAIDFGLEEGGLCSKAPKGRMKGPACSTAQRPPALPNAAKRISAVLHAMALKGDTGRALLAYQLGDIVAEAIGETMHTLQGVLSESRVAIVARIESKIAALEESQGLTLSFGDPAESQVEPNKEQAVTPDRPLNIPRKVSSAARPDSNPLSTAPLLQIDATTTLPDAPVDEEQHVSSSSGAPSEAKMGVRSQVFGVSLVPGTPQPGGAHSPEVSESSDCGLISNCSSSGDANAKVEAEIDARRLSRYKSMQVNHRRDSFTSSGGGSTSQRVNGTPSPMSSSNSSKMTEMIAERLNNKEKCDVFDVGAMQTDLLVQAQRVRIAVASSLAPSPKPCGKPAEIYSVGETRKARTDADMRPPHGRDEVSQGGDSCESGLLSFCLSASSPPMSECVKTPSIRMSELRQEQDMGLVTAGSQHSIEFLGIPREVRTIGKEDFALVRWVLKLGGIVPCDGCSFAPCAEYILAVLVLCTLLRCACLIGMGAKVQYVELCTAIYGLGGVCGLAFLRRGGMRSLLGPKTQMLMEYARNRNFEDAWLRSSSRRIMTVSVLWLIGVLLRGAPPVIAAAVSCSIDSEDNWLWSWASFVVASGGLAILTCLQLHVFAAMEIMVDNYCVHFFAVTNFTFGVTEWCVMQALLRRVAKTADSCFLAIQTSGLAVFLLASAELLVYHGVGSHLEADRCTTLWGFSLLRLLSTMAPAFSAPLTFYLATVISEKCSRVPSLINALSCPGDNLSLQRQYVVQYIKASEAGLYVKGVRLTANMVVKLTYLCGMVTFGLITKTLNESSSDSLSR